MSVIKKRLSEKEMVAIVAVVVIIAILVMLSLGFNVKESPTLKASAKKLATAGRAGEFEEESTEAVQQEPWDEDYC